VKCAICGKEINGGFVVEEECLEKLKSDLEFSILETENKHGIDKLEAENARLKNDRKLFTEIHETVKSIGGKTRELSEENGQLLLENAELDSRTFKVFKITIYYYGGAGVFGNKITYIATISSSGHYVDVDVLEVL